MSQEVLPAAATRRRMVVFWLAASTSFLLYLHRYTWNVIRPELQQEYGFSNTMLEGLGTVFYATYAFGSIPSGVLIDLLGAHLVLVVIILVWSLTVPLQGITGNVWVLGAVRLLFGAAQTGAYPALGQVTRNWFPRSSRTQVQGWVASFFGRGGGALSSIIMATLLMGYLGLSWQAALVVMAVPGVLFAVLFHAMFRNTPEDDPQANETERELIRGDDRVIGESRGVISTKRVLACGSIRVMVVQQFMNAGADIVYTLLMGSYFLSLGVADMKELGWMVALPLVGGALGGVLGGFLNDRLILSVGSRWGRSLVGVSGKFLAAAALFVAMLQPTPERVAVVLFFVKLFTDSTQPTVWGTCTDIGGRFAATVFSIVNTAGNIGAMVMPLVYGPLLDYYSSTQNIGGEERVVTDFTPVFVLVGALYVGAGVCWLLVDCNERVDEPAETRALS